MCDAKIYDGKRSAETAALQPPVLAEIGKKFQKGEHAIGSMIVSLIRDGVHYRSDVEITFLGDKVSKEEMDKYKHCYDGITPTMVSAKKTIANAVMYPKPVSLLSSIPSPDDRLPSGLYVENDVSLVSVKTKHSQVFISYHEGDDEQNVEMLLVITVALSRILNNQELSNSCTEMAKSIIEEHPSLKELPYRVLTFLERSSNKVISEWRKNLQVGVPVAS